MMKRPLLLPLMLVLAALLMLSACGGDDLPAGSDTTAHADSTAEPAKSTSADKLSDKYDNRVNGISVVAGTFTDRLTTDQVNQAMKMGQSADAGPLLYNLVQVMGLTRDDIVLYSEMNGDKLLLEAELIDGLFLEGDAMREALRGDYTIMAGGIPYTVYDLAVMSVEDLAALGIPEADLRAFLTGIPAAAEKTGEQLDPDVEALIAAYVGE